MAKRDGQEGLFRDTIRWAMSNNSGTSVDDHSQLKQPDVGRHEVEAVAVNGGKKRNHGGVRIKRENDESDGEDKKGIRDQQSSDHAKHLWTEKKRRKKMKNMFQELQALLPKQHPKAKLLTIVDDAISHIQNLQQILLNLETQKLERLNSPSTNTSVTSMVHPQKQTADPFIANGSSSSGHSHSASCPDFGPFSFLFRSKPAFQTWASSNVILNVCGPDAHINICSPKKPGLLASICAVLEKCKLDVMTFHISSDQTKSLFLIHARVNAPDDFVAAFSYEEIYKLAALEMMNLVNSKSL